jgi:sugar phosphate isomerase/epimerase
MKTFILLGSTMGFIYLSDKNEEEVGLFPGEGNMPLESLLIKLQEINYTGHFSIAVDPSALMAGSPDATIVARMNKARAFVKKYFK